MKLTNTNYIVHQKLKQKIDGKNGQYWWMNAPDSPFKKSEQTPVYSTAASPCSVSGGCTASSSNININQVMDLSKNPFLSSYAPAQPAAHHQYQEPQAPQQQYNPQPQYQDQYYNNVHNGGAPCYQGHNHQAATPIAAAPQQQYYTEPSYQIPQQQQPKASGSRVVNVASYNQIDGGNGTKIKDL